MTRAMSRASAGINIKTKPWPCAYECVWLIPDNPFILVGECSSTAKLGFIIAYQSRNHIAGNKKSTVAWNGTFSNPTMEQ